MNEIPISKRNTIVIGLLVAVLTGGIILLQQLTSKSYPVTTSIPANDQQAAEAAEQAVEAFFSIDYQEGMGSWQNRLCSLTTEGGCQFIAMGSSSMWTRYLEENTTIQADATPVTQLASTDREQVWQMKIALSEPLPGSNKLEDTAYVAVSKTGSGWKFDRFLLEPEINALLKKQDTAADYGRNF